MSSINERGTGVPIGLQKRLPPWEIAAKLLPIDGGVVSLKDATDDQFQAFVVSTGMRIRDNGIAEWSFDDRIRFVNFALHRGVSLPFVEQNNSENDSDSELFEGPPSASQDKGA